MATLAHPATANQVSFGQLGAVYTKASAAQIKPPTGKVFVAITMLEDTTFDSSGGLVSEIQTKYFNTVGAAHDLDNNSETADQGSGGLQITNSMTFPKGVTVFGRWTEIDVNSGSCIAYISD